MFRLQNNVPEVYVEESRDFQLFCRLYDAVFGGVKYSADSLARTSITRECNNNLLELLKTKVGFFTKLQLDEFTLRQVLEIFPYLIRYKGSKQGIQYMLILFQHITGQHSPCGIANYSTMNNEHVLKISFEKKPKRMDLLIELLKYILPTGYNVEIVQFTPSESTTSIVLSDIVNYDIVPDPDDLNPDPRLNSRLVHDTDDMKSNDETLLLLRNTVGMARITHDKPKTNNEELEKTQSNE